MPITGLGTKRRGFRIPFLALISGGFLLAALVMFAIELGRFAQGRDLLQVEMTVGSIPIPIGLKLSEVVNIWESVYAQPVELDYQNNRILMYPSDIGFNINSDLMQEEIKSKIAGTDNYWQDFWNYLWRRPTSPIVVDLIADYQEAKLRNYLQDVAARYEKQASAASFDMSTLSFNNGSEGLHLDIDTAMQSIDAALRRPTSRKVKLPLVGENAHSADMGTLKQAIQDYLATKGILLDAHDGQSIVGSVVAIDLQTRQEVDINPDVAYSAMSTIKIPIMLTIFRKLDLAPTPDTKWLMGASILCSSNSASNYLIQESGTGGSKGEQLANGLSQVNQTVETLGAKNTYISAPLYVGDPTYQFSITRPPTSPDKGFDTKADFYSQTTASDMATLLEQIYDCSEFGSGVKAIFPDSYTQVECKEMINLLSGNIIGRLIELGVPPGTKVAHKNGWGGTATSGANVSDAAIVYTNGGAYILVVYMWEPKANQDGIGTLKPWEAIEGISQIVYNYFNPDNPMTTPRVPENPYGAIDCVMPNPKNEDLLDLSNISNGRFDSEGHILPDACFNYPQCDPIPARQEATPVPQPIQPQDLGTQSVGTQGVGTQAAPPGTTGDATAAPDVGSTPTLPPPPPK